MSAQLHRDAFRDAAPDHVANRGAPQVVWDSARASGRKAGSLPRLVERADRLRCFCPPRVSATSRENTRGSILSCPLQPQVLCMLGFEKPVKVIGQEEHPTLTVLRSARVESDFAGFQIDLTPLEGQHFADDAPARDVRELHDWAKRRRQAGLRRSRTAPDRRTRFGVLSSRSRGMWGL